MKTARNILAGAAFVVASLAAIAAPVRYNFTSDLAPVGTNTGGNFSGYVEFDDSLMVANAVISTSSFTDWAFTWGTDFSYGPSVDQFDPNFALFVLDASLNVGQADLCFSGTGICNTDNHPVARVLTAAVGATYDANGGQAADTGQWSGPQVTTRLPEPASLALTGVALMGLALARRRRG